MLSTLAFVTSRSLDALDWHAATFIASGCCGVVYARSARRCGESIPSPRSAPPAGIQVLLAQESLALPVLGYTQQVWLPLAIRRAACSPHGVRQWSGSPCTCQQAADVLLMPRAERICTDDELEDNDELVQLSERVGHVCWQHRCLPGPLRCPGFRRCERHTALLSLFSLFRDMLAMSPHLTERNITMNKHIIQSGTARLHEVSLIVCASLLASEPMQQVYQPIVEDLDAARVECSGALTDALIPGANDVDGLLACAISDPSLLSDEPEDYDHHNTHSPAALLYENLYRQVYAWVEVYLGEIIRLAMLIRRVQDEASADRAFRRTRW